jgi:PKD repeat protein
LLNRVNFLFLKCHLIKNFSEVLLTLANQAMQNKRYLGLSFLTILFVTLFALNSVTAQSVDFTYTGKCAQSPTLFEGSVTGITAVQWNWSMGDGTTLSGQNITHTYTAPNYAGYSVVLTVIDNIGDEYTINKFVPISGEPTSSFMYDGNATCSADSIQFTDLSYSNPHIIRYVWIWGDGSDNDTIYYPNNPDIKHKFAGVNTYIVQLEVMSADSCTNTSSQNITIKASPTANFHFNGSCQGTEVQFTDASNPNGSGGIAYWNWDFDDPTSGVNNTSTDINPVHIFSMPGTYNVRLVVTNFNTCTDTMIKQVVINEKPRVNFTFTPTCLNEVIHFTPDSNYMNLNSIATYSWNFGDGFTASTANAVHTYDNAGTYPVTLTVVDTNGCHNDTTITITVNELPLVNFIFSSNNCAGSEVQFTDLTTLSYGFITEWVWDFGDGTSITVPMGGNQNVKHTYSLAGTFTVRLTVYASDSCSNFFEKPITIRPNPIANFDYVNTCQDQDVQFQDISQLGGGGAITNWYWDFGDQFSPANTSQLRNPTHKYSQSGQYSVTLVVVNENTCSDTIIKDITIQPKPDVDFTWDAGCSQQPIVFSPDSTVVNVGAIQEWLWDFGDGTFSNLPVATHTYTGSNAVVVTLTVTDTVGCSNSIQHTVELIPKPIVYFTNSTPVCKDSPVSFFVNTTSYGIVNLWEWEFGDGTTQTVTSPGSPNVEHVYTQAGTVTATVTVTTEQGCFNSYSKQIVVRNNPLANFTYTDSCQSEAIVFTNLTQAGEGSIANWYWNFGDPASGAGNTSSLQNPTHIYNTPGVYNVTLIAENSFGCPDTIVKTINIVAKPAVDFTYEVGCVNDTTQFTLSPIVQVENIVSFEWDFGDGYTSNAQNPVHIFTGLGPYYVTLTIVDNNGCTNSITKEVLVSTAPTAQFQVSSYRCTMQDVLFTDASVVAPPNSIIRWVWDFGDGSDTTINAPGNPNVSHKYNLPNNYQVTLTVHTSNGCENSKTIGVTIYASPIADFTFENSCQGEAVQFTNTTQLNNGSSISNYSWNFGDPTTGINNTSILENPIHIFSGADLYQVLLKTTNANGCWDTVTKNVNVKAKPAVAFVYDSICQGYPITFYPDSTVMNLQAITTFDWNFGDGTPNIQIQSPSHVYANPGNYTVTLTVVDTAGCSNSFSKEVTVNPKPTANFSTSTNCVNSTTQFNDLSYVVNNEPIVAWYWDFGSGGATSTLQNPTHVYNQIGVYDVSLIVTTYSGCKDTIQKPVEIFRTPVANFTYNNNSCQDATVHFQDSSYAVQSQIVSYYWIFDPNNHSTLQNPVYVFPYADSTYYVTLIVTNSFGCSDTIVKEVYVDANFDFTFTSTVTCFGDTTYFAPQLISPEGDSLMFFTWEFDDPNSGIHNTSNLRNPYHVFSYPSTYNVSLTATNQDNCVLKRTKPVTILELPEPNFSYSQGVCDSVIYFTDLSVANSSNISHWIWSFGDGINQTVNFPNNPNVSHQYSSHGFYDVSLTVVNSEGCTDSIVIRDVFVKPCIEANFAVIDSMICQNSILTFIDSSASSSGITEWYWNFGDGTDTTYNSYMSEITHRFTGSGMFNIKLLVTSQIGNRFVSDSTVRTILVGRSPIADFEVEKLCVNNPVKFTNKSSANGTIIDSVLWTFALPTDTSTVFNPTFTYTSPGNYNVVLYVQNHIGCYDTAQRVVSINGLPRANFNFSQACEGTPLQFNDMSVNSIAPIVNWKWLFSSPDSSLIGTSNKQNASFVFGQGGEHWSTLIVTDSVGCSDTVTKPVDVYLRPIGIFNTVPNFNNVQGQVKLENNSIGAAEYIWDFGNFETSSMVSPVVYYQQEGKYTIQLVSISENNCTDTTYRDYEFIIKGLYVPTAFSPTSEKDEIKYFKPVGANLREYQICVYDRWGDKIWSSDELDAEGKPKEAWDGTYNNEPVPAGVYTWKVSAVFKDGTTWNAINIGTSQGISNERWGTVTLIR